MLLTHVYIQNINIYPNIIRLTAPGVPARLVKRNMGEVVFVINLREIIDTI